MESMTILVESPEDQMIRAEQSERLVNLLRTLTPREEAVILMHLGFNGSPQSFVQMSKQWCVSNQRLSQIYHRAIRKLRRRMNRDPWEELYRRIMEADVGQSK